MRARRKYCSNFIKRNLTSSTNTQGLYNCFEVYFLAMLGHLCDDRVTDTLAKVERLMMSYTLASYVISLAELPYRNVRLQNTIIPF